MITLYSEEDKELFEVSEEDQNAGKWYLPWSDLSFILFILLFAYINTDGKKNEPVEQAKQTYVSAAPPAIRYTTTKKEDLLYAQAREIISDFKDISVEYEGEKAIKISVQGPLFFDTGKASLKKPAIKFLKRISKIILAKDYKVDVIGHTDNVPISTPLFETNWELSVMRATKVARYLIEHRGIEPERFTVSGNSKFHPKVPNSDFKSKAKNRRVEIIITRDDSF